jgi:hypothetical protein
MSFSMPPHNPCPLVNWTLRDCALHGGEVILGKPDTGLFWGIELGYYYGASAVTWENNLFDGVSVRDRA